MSEELQNWCQVELETLLLQRERLLKKYDQVSSEDCELPHYKNLLSLYKSLEETELFLLEINDKLKSLEREKQTEDLKTAFSSLRLKETSTNDQSKSSIQNWFLQILRSMEVEGDASGLTCSSTEKLFFDVDFHEDNEKEYLSWSTLYKGRCIRVSVRAPVMCTSTNPADYVFQSSFYVNGLINGGKEHISSGKTAEDYTRLLWSDLQDLIDVT